MQPLRITAELGAPVVASTSLPLDAILLYYSMLELYGRPLASARPGETVVYDPEIVPLQILRDVDDGGVWIYACSFAQWGEPHTDGVSHWNKRFDMDYTYHLSPKYHNRKIATSKGAYRPHHQPVRYRHARHVQWCCVGEQERIAHLLAMIDFIGKKTAQGWGYVRRWHIEPMSTDRSVLGPDYVPMRAIPRPMYLSMTGGRFSVNMTICLRGFRPPYWYRGNQGEVVEPYGL